MSTKIYFLKGYHGENQWLVCASMGNEYIKSKKVGLDEFVNKHWDVAAFRENVTNLGYEEYIERLQSEIGIHDKKCTLCKKYKTTHGPTYFIDEIELVE